MYFCVSHMNVLRSFIVRAVPASLSVSFCLLAALLSSSGCASAANNVQTVTLGLVAPLTGEAQILGQDWVRAAKGLIAAWNDASNQNTLRVRLVVYDQSEGAAVAGRLAADPTVVGAVGYWQDGLTDEVRVAFRDAGLSVVSLAFPPDQQTDSPSAMLHFMPTQSEIHRGAGTFVRGNLKTDAVTLVIGPTVQDLARAREFQEQVARVGVSDVRVQAAPPYVSDYRNLLGRLNDTAPGTVVFVGAAGSSSEFLSQLKSSEFGQMLRVIFLSNPMPVADKGAALVPHIEAYWVSGFSGSEAIDEAEAFVASVREETGRAPHPSTLAAYDGVKLFLNGLEKMMATQKAPSRVGAQRFLSQTTAYQGLAQRYDFDGRGRLLNPSVYLRRLPGDMFTDQVEVKVAVPSVR